MTSVIAALVLAQPWSLNLNTQPIEARQSGTRLTPVRQYAIDCQTNMTCVADGGVLILNSSGGGGGAPATATYLTQTPDGTLSNEQAMSLLGTGLMSNTTGTGVVSIYAGSTCGANQYATSTNSSGALTCSQVTTAQLSGTITNAQLASSYSGVGVCGANTWASTLSANAAPTCTQPGFSNLSGSATTGQLPTIPVTKGGTNLTTIASNQVWVGTAADTVAAKTVPSCSNATTSKLLFDNTTQTFSCGTDQGGSGSGLSYAEVQRRVAIGGP